MHITNTHSTSLLALLIAASSAIASPVIGNQGKGSVDTPFSGSIHGSTSYGQQQPLFNNIHGSSHAFEQGSSAISSYIQPSVLKDSLNPSDYEKLIQHVNGLPERRIIALSEHEQDRHLITEGQKALLTFHGIKFMDITEDVLNNVSPASGAGVLSSDDDDDHLPFSASASDLTSLSTSTTTTTTSSNNKDSDAFPTSWKYGRKQLDKSFYKNIDTSRMKTFLQAFSSFRTRYYRSNDGRQSQLYLMQKIHEIITKKENKHLNMTVEEFPHPWGQNSLIVKLPATNHNNSDDNINNVNNVKGTIVVGAHQDSTNLLPFLSAPGADDDGSGTTTVLEVIQILTQGHFIPSSHNVEFHFYSAEEGGMLGSQAVVKAYQERASHSSHSQKVKAMLQMDMTAYVKPGTKERIGIIQDFVSPALTKFVTRLIEEYNDIPSVETACKYACSDHSSWTKIGLPSAFAIEATFEDSNTRHIHTSGDTIDVEGFSFDHMAQFVQLASAFVVELSS